MEKAKATTQDDVKTSVSSIYAALLSKRQAKKAMEDMHEVGIETGKGIGEVFAKKEYLERGKK